jgi:hypothetical protein
MGDRKNPNDKPVADAQRAHWQATYTAGAENPIHDL